MLACLLGGSCLHIRKIAVVLLAAGVLRGRRGRGKRDTRQRGREMEVAERLPMGEVDLAEK